MLLVLLIAGVMMGTASALIVPSSSVGNYSKVTAYATNIFGWHMAWVTSKWTFATYPNGEFRFDGNTFLDLSTGGHLGDYGSWDSTDEVPEYTQLNFYGGFTLHGVSEIGNDIHGVMYNRVVFVERLTNGKLEYMIYYGVNEQLQEPEYLPIEFVKSFDE